MKTAWIVLVVLAVLFTLATVRGLVVGDLIARGPVVDAVVIGTRTSTDRQGVGDTVQTRYAPVLQIAWQGAPVTLAMTTGYRGSVTWKEGDMVRVRVNEAAPELSQVDTLWGTWGLSAIKLCLPLVLWALVLGLRGRVG